MKLIKNLSCCLLFLSFTFNGFSQDIKNISALEILKQVSESHPKVFDYSETPYFCIGNSKNIFKHLSLEQLKVLETYGYPKFLSHGYNALEKDIMSYQLALKDWEEKAEIQKTEIQNIFYKI